MQNSLQENFSLPARFNRNCSQYPWAGIPGCWRNIRAVMSTGAERVAVLLRVLGEQGVGAARLYPRSLDTLEVLQRHLSARSPGGEVEMRRIASASGREMVEYRIVQRP